MKSDFIPRPDAKFHAWQGNLVDKLDPVAGALGITEAAMTALHTKKARWDAAYKKAEDPATRTKAAVIEKKEAREDYMAYLRDFNNIYLLHNPGLTDANREDFGLPVHKTTRTPAEVAKTYPSFDIDSGTIRRLIIHFFDHGQQKSKAKPPGQHGAEIRWARLEAPPASLTELTNSSFDTHTPFTFDFDENERGQTVYFCLRWENTRGQKGPWSEIVSAIVP
jgi:hypothetical protein